MSHRINVENNCFHVPPPPTVLQVSEDELKPDLLASFEWESTKWQVAAIASEVALGGLIFAVFTATILYAPVLIPMTGISSLVLYKIVHKFTKSFEKDSDKANQRAEQLREIQRLYGGLYTGPNQIQRSLDDIGVHNVTGMERNDPNLPTLAPLIARYKFWQGHTKKLELQKQDKFKEATRLVLEDFKENRKKIYKLRSEALEIENLILESKIKNAFNHAALCNPNATCTLDAIGDISPLSGKERAIAAPLGGGGGGGGADEFFTFKARDIAPIRYTEVQESSVAELAARLLPVMI